MGCAFSPDEAGESQSLGISARHMEQYFAPAPSFLLHVGQKMSLLHLSGGGVSSSLGCAGMDGLGSPDYCCPFFLLTPAQTAATIPNIPAMGNSALPNSGMLISPRTVKFTCV